MTIDHNTRSKNMKKTQNKWPRRIGIGAAAAASLLMLGATFQIVELHVDAARHTPPGKWLDVDGHALHLYATGAGGPTVVLETGASAYYGVWEWIQPELAKHTRVVSYDRAGLGFSEAADGPRDAASIARELDQLLTKAGEKAPYVLVGHSYGALFVSEYAHLYPQKVAGLVLVDGTHPDQIQRSREMRESMDLFRRMFHLTSAAAHFGVMRFTDLFSAMAEGLSAEQLDVAQSLYASPRHLDASARELDAWSESSTQARKAQLGSYPKLFLSASGPDTREVRDFKALHQELADRFPGAVHRTLPGTTHITMVTHRDQSQQVTSAILEVVEQARRQ